MNIYIYVYVCMYVCMYVYIYTDIYIYVYMEHLMIAGRILTRNQWREAVVASTSPSGGIRSPEARACRNFGSFLEVEGFLV